MVFEAHNMSFSMYRTLIIQLCQGKYSFTLSGTFKIYKNQRPIKGIMLLN